MKKEIFEHIAKELNTKILEFRTCKWCSEEFPIFELQDKIEKKLKINYKQDLCFSCFMRKLMMFRNETNIYKNKCQKCGKETISIYSPESGKKIYCKECFLKSDFLIKDNFKINIDNIWEDYYKLYKQTPIEPLVNQNNENSLYANYTTTSKNIYLSYVVHCSSSDILYSYYITYSNDSIDCYGLRESQKCYECINVIESYNCFYGNNLVNCNDIYFGINLKNCKNCIFCSDLLDKQYYINNKKYKKEKYFEILKELKDKFGTKDGLKMLLQEYETLEIKAIYKNLQTLNVEDTIGNYISNVNKSILVFNSDDIENCINIFGAKVKNSINLIGGQDVEYCINSTNVGYQIQNIFGSFGIGYSSNIINSNFVYHSNDVMFSCSLTNKSYFILNRKFEKQKYKELEKQIKNMKNYGGFFDTKFLDFPYNDSSAIQNYPINKIIFPNKKELIFDENGKGKVYILEPEKFLSKAILDLGGREKINILWRTSEKEINIPEGTKFIKVGYLPNNIQKITKEEENKILNSAIICEDSKRPFKIMKYELEFYKNHSISLPTKHPKIRHANRVKKVQKRELNFINCNKCGKQVLTSHCIKDDKIIYCEKCYDDMIY